MTTTQETLRTPAYELALVIRALEEAAKYPEVLPLGLLASSFRPTLSPEALALLDTPAICMAVDLLVEATIAADEAGTPIFADEDFNYGYPDYEDEDEDDYCQFCDCNHTYEDAAEDEGGSLRDLFDEVGDLLDSFFQKEKAVSVWNEPEEEDPLADLLAALGIDADTVAVYQVKL